MPDLSVIIVTHNSGRWIGPCLASLSSQEVPEGFSWEVAVIDNASTDGTPAFVRSAHPRIAFKENARNTGFAAAANQGAAMVGGEFLLFLNPDTILQANFFRCVKEQFLGGGYNVIGCRIIDQGGVPQISSWKPPTLLTTLAESFLPHQIAVRLVTTRTAGTHPVAMISGACMMIRRSLYVQHRGFDERFFLYYEDSDLCFRLRAAGESVYFTDQMAVTHYGRASTAGKPEEFVFQVYRSKLLFLRKHRGKAAGLLAWLFMSAGVAIRIPAYGIVGFLAGSKELLQLMKSHTMVLPRMLHLLNEE